MKHLKTIRSAVFMLAASAALAADGSGIQSKFDNLLGVIMAIITSVFALVIAWMALQAAGNKKGWGEVMNTIAFCFVGMCSSGIVAWLKLTAQGTFN
jgi:hypothetical protein